MFQTQAILFSQTGLSDLQSALKGDVAGTAQGCHEDFHVAFTARKTPSPCGCLQNTDSLRIWLFFRAGHGDYLSRESTCIIAGEIYMFNFLSALEAFFLKQIILHDRVT